MLSLLHSTEVVVRADDAAVDVNVEERDGALVWSVTNDTHASVPVESVAVAGHLGPVGVDPRMVVNGYQSWSPTGMRRVGVDRDPSTRISLEAVRGAYHADPGMTEVLRSELVTVIDLDTGAPRLAIGFDGASDHDGTIRVEREGGGLRVTIEAYLGGARLAPGERRDLHSVRAERGDDPSQLLESWANRLAATQQARAGAPHRMGWCSWYHYFHEVGEKDLRDNLVHAGDWGVDVFQLDDGFQSAVGDWLTTNARFPSDLSSIASAIRAAGCAPGIWIAPFLAHEGSEVGRAHPGWFAREKLADRPLVGMVNEHWGGLVHTLDTTDPDVLAHLEATAGALVDAGFEYLKLDFTYAPSLPGRFRDPSRTPAQRVRAGFDAIRRGAGEQTFLLGCGAPIGPCVGVVDGMRIGPDVAPRWDPEPGGPGYDDSAPAVVNAWRSTLVRAFMHRKLWLNDPDCVMLRTGDTSLSRAAARAWALAVGTSGGMVVLSDDLARLDADAHALLEETLALGQEADAGARAGSPPRCDDLMTEPVPTRLSAAGRELVGTLDPPSARLV